jgi:hypothetical protein
MMAASIVSSHQTMEQFWAKAVTGTVRYCSMTGLAGLRRPAPYTSHFQPL